MLPLPKRQRIHTAPCQQVLHNSDLLLYIADFLDPLECNLPIALTLRCFYLVSRNKKPVLKSAAKHFCSGLTLLRWAISQKCPIDPRTAVAAAAFRGNLDVLKFLFEESFAKIKAGYLPVMSITRVRAASEDFWSSALVDAAIRSGDIEMLQWIRIQPHMVTTGIDLYDHLWVTAIQAAARVGHLHVLKWLRTWTWQADKPYFDNVWDSKLISAAAQGGQQQVIEWALHLGHAWNVRTCTQAAVYGHLELLKWLRTPRGEHPPCPWDEFTASLAARAGQLTILQWLRNQDPPCPWSSTCCDEAFFQGHTRILMWCRTQQTPCPWDDFPSTTRTEEQVHREMDAQNQEQMRIRESAVQRGRLLPLPEDWVWENGWPVPPPGLAE